MSLSSLSSSINSTNYNSYNSYNSTVQQTQNSEFLPSINPPPISNEDNQIDLSSLSLQERLDFAENKETSLNIQRIMNGGYDSQLLGEITDDIMLSEEAQEEMNQIKGTDGEDIIKGSLNKENGNIIINVNGQDYEYTPEEAAKGFKIDSGNGNDNVDISAIIGNFVIDAGEGDNNLNLSQGRNIVETGDGNNTITADNAHRTKITTGDGNNNINITEGQINTITTGSGKDNITTNGNNYSNSKINSGAGNDNITVKDGKNTINGGDGNDKITAGDGKNTINGGNGNDEITVGNGNNEISIKKVFSNVLKADFSI